jgi:hypothetical protein
MFKKEKEYKINNQGFKLKELKKQKQTEGRKKEGREEGRKEEGRKEEKKIIGCKVNIVFSFYFIY